MTSEAKAYNELLKSLSGRKNLKGREIQPPVIRQTHNSKCNSWADVKIGNTLNESKHCIPAENISPTFLSKTVEQDCINDVVALLSANSIVQGPDGVFVHLDVPEGEAGEVSTLENRARHLCGGHEYHFDKERAKYAGCIVSTVCSAALIAKNENGDRRFYLRKYKNRFLHIVITTGDGERLIGQACQRSCDLITQYIPLPIQQFDGARIIYKNPNPSVK